jgi:chromosome segregation ATPase
MPRHAPLDQSDVWTAADGLLNEGVQPTAERIRQRLGRASRDHLGSHLDTWFTGLASRLQDGTEAGPMPALPSHVLDAAGELWRSACAGAQEEVRAKVDQLEHDLGYARSEADAGAAAAATAQEHALALESKLQTQVGELARVADERDRAQAEAIEAQVRLGQAATEIAVRDEHQLRLGAELAAVREAHAGLVARAEEQFTAFGAERRALEARRVEIEQQHGSDLDAARREHAELQQQHDQRVAALESEQRALQQQFATTEQRLTADLDVLRQERSGLQQQHAELQQQHQLRVASLEADHRSLEQQIAATEQRLAGELDAARRAHAELQQQHDLRVASMESEHQARVGEFTANERRLTAEIDELRLLAADLHEQLVAMTKERDELGDLTDELSESEETLRESVEVLTAELAQARADAQTRTQSLQAALDERDHQLTHLVEGIDAIRVDRDAAAAALAAQRQQAANDSAAAQVRAQSLQAALDERDHQVTQLVEGIDAIRVDKDAAAAALAAQQQQAANESAAAQAHAQALQAALDDRDHQVTQLAQGIDAIRVDKDAAATAFDERLRATEQRLAADVDRARDEAGQLYLRLLEVEQERDQYAALGTTLAESDEEHRAALAAAADRAAGLERTAAAQVARLTSQAERIGALEVELAELQAEAAELRSRIDRQSAEQTRLAADGDAERARLASDLEEQLAQRDAEVERLEYELHEAREHAATLAAGHATETRTLEAEYDALERRIADQAERQSLEVGDAHETAAQLAARLDAAQAEAAATITLMSERIESLGGDNRALAAELGASRQQIEELQARLQSFDELDADADADSAAAAIPQSEDAATVVSVAAAASDPDRTAQLQAELDELRGQLWAKDAQCRTLMRSLAAQSRVLPATPATRRIERPRRAPSPRM